MPANYEQPRDVVKRVRFFDGQYLKDQDFVDDQKYHLDRQRRPNRLLRVPGICEGLELLVENNQVQVTPGTAVDSQGRLIVLSGDPVMVDLKDQTDAIDIFIAYGDEESDIAQPGNGQPATTTTATVPAIQAATRWWEKPRIEAVKDRSNLKAESPIWLGRVTVSGSGSDRAVALTTVGDREYSGIRLPSSTNPVEAPVLRSGGSVNPKLAVLTGDLKIQGSAANNSTAALHVTDSASTSLLYVRTDGNVGIGTLNPAAKLAINGGLHVGGDSDPGDNNLLVDGTSTLTGNVSMGGTLAVTGTSTLTGNVSMGGTLAIAGALNFGSTVRQMITLWGTTNYGIGVQNGTQYFRTDKNFAWYRGGSHNDAELNAGANGTVQMVIKDGNVGIGTLNPAAKLAINGGLHVGGDSDPGDNNLLVDGTSTLTGNVSMGGTLAVTGSTTLTSNVRIGTNTDAAFGLTPSNGSPNAGYIRFGDGTGWKLHFARSKETSGGDPNTGTTGILMTIQDNGNVGIGTTSSGSKLHIDKGRVDITASDATGGGQNRFNGLLLPTQESFRRSQLVLSSGYSDLVIASSSANNRHGSTLTFATYNPGNANEYRKWVINQGNWGDRRQFLEFGYSDIANPNPHDYISEANTVLTLDGVNKRVGIGMQSPGERLEVNGTVKATKFVGEGAVATGMILMWSGRPDQVPSGWALCDGRNGTPNLVDRFVLGSREFFNGTQDQARIGGESTHSHSVIGGGTWSLNPSLGSSRLDNVSHLPPYYKLAYIIKL